MPKINSDKELKNRLERGSSGGLPIKRVKAENSPLLVRFLTGCNEWAWFDGYFDESTKRSVILDDGDSPPAGQSIRTRWLANVILPDDDLTTVWALELPASLAGEIGAQYLDKGGEGTGTAYITGRDFELFRKGSGKNDTKYSFAPEAPMKRKITGLDLLDLDDIISRMGHQASEDDDTVAEVPDADEVDTDDVDAEEEETEQGDEMPDFSSMTVTAIKKWITSMEYEVPESKDKDEVIEEATAVWVDMGGALPEADAEEEEAEEEAEEEEAEEEAEEAEEEAADDDVYTRKELQAMTLADLKEIATENGVDPVRHSKSQLIDILLGEEEF